MTTIVKRYPTFEVELVTEKTSYELTYDTDKQLRQTDFEQALISFSVKNSMADDSPVFSLVVLGKEKWDKMINSNDLVRIKAIPDTTQGIPNNPYIMVGMVSEIRKEGEYEDGSIVYRITGQAMTKALLNFDVGVIQEVATIIPSFGWLPDDADVGLKFTGSNAAEIGSELMERFVFKYAKYDFQGKGLSDYFTHEFLSWTEDEYLADPTPFINYQGSLRQFLEDIAAKPFNELFFEYTIDGKCIAIMRPTPFDKSKWNQLMTYTFTSDSVVQESFGKSDTEMYSVFVVQAPNLVEFNSMDLGVYPKFHPSLIEKYGYKRLDAENRYLLTSAVPGATSTGDDTLEGVTVPVFDELLVFIGENDYQEPEILRTQRNAVHTAIIQRFPGMSATLVDGVIDSIAEGSFDRETYNTLSTSSDAATNPEANREKIVASDKLERYTQRLFNWYCENSNFYSGDIRVIGNPSYRVGTRVLYDDLEQKTTWEFYTEAVQHEFSFTNGYTTILGVTRGLPDKGAKRFSNLWGKSEDFKGGYLGEKTMEELVQTAKDATPSTDGGGMGGPTFGGGGSGGNIAMSALATARAMAKKSSIYTFGGGRTQNSPFNHSPILVDCSSFVFWCYHAHGVTLAGGKTGVTTDTIKNDSKFVTVSKINSSKTAALNSAKAGDLVYFNTYKIDGHVGIYIGDGKFVGAQGSTGIAEANMSSGYWFDKFNGRVVRYPN